MFFGSRPSRSFEPLGLHNQRWPAGAIAAIANGRHRRADLAHPPVVCWSRPGRSSRPLVILHDVQRLSDGTGLVFPNPRGKPLSDATLSQLITALGIAAVPHGFRSSFRDWAAEQTNTPREVVEAALAHTVRNPTEAAYARSDLFERRRRLMDEWAAYRSEAHRQTVA